MKIYTSNRRHSFLLEISYGHFVSENNTDELPKHTNGIAKRSHLVVGTGALKSVGVVELEGLHHLGAARVWKEGLHEALQGDNTQLFWVHLLHHDLHTKGK